MIIIRGPKVFSLQPFAAQAGFLFPRSTHLVVRHAAILGAILAALMLSAATASAEVLIDGDDLIPSASVGDPVAGALQAATMMTTASAGTGSDAWTANFTTTVYYDSPSNPYYNGTISSIDEAMTFVYQVNVTSSTGDVGEVDISSFGPNQTDVGYYDQTQDTDQSQVLPLLFSRDASGISTSTVSFLFFDVAGQYTVIGPGETSALLVVNTDATNFTSSYAELQDGANVTTPTYAIFGTMVATPEPASVVLMIIGLTGLLAVARSRRSNRFAVRTGL